MASACLCGFAFLALRLATGQLEGFDESVYDALQRCDTPIFHRTMTLLTFCGSIWVILPVALTLLTVGIFRKSFRFRGLLSALNPAVAWLLNYLLKSIFRRPRPDEARWLVTESGFSFPSAHTMVSAAFYGSLICLCLIFFRRPWNGICAFLLFLLAFAIGVSRVFLGVHYPSDVAAGLCAGFAQAFLFAYLTERFGRDDPEPDDEF